MAGEAVTLNTLENEVSLIIANIINGKEGWSEEDKQRVQCQYMKEYSEVLREMVPGIAQLLNKPLSHHPQSSKQEEVVCREKEEMQEEDNKGTRCESLEDVEIRHEGTLIAVTKKRKEYPASLAALLGKTVRLQKNSVEAMKVELPLRAPLEMGEGTERLDERIKCQVEEILTPLAHGTQNIQQQTHRLNHMAQAAEVVINNHNHPIEALLSHLSQVNAP